MTRPPVIQGRDLRTRMAIERVREASGSKDAIRGEDWAEEGARFACRLLGVRPRLADSLVLLVREGMERGGEAAVSDALGDLRMHEVRSALHTRDLPTSAQWLHLGRLLGAMRSVERAGCVADAVPSSPYAEPYALSRALRDGCGATPTEALRTWERPLWRALVERWVGRVS